MKKRLFFAIMACLISTASFANCTDAVTTKDRANCQKSDFEAEDAKLNAAYSKLKSLAHTYFSMYDPVTKQEGNGVEPALLKSQRAWIKYRDDNCSYYYSTYYPGTEAGVVFEQCKTRMTIERTKELEKEYQFWSSR